MPQHVPFDADNPKHIVAPAIVNLIINGIMLCFMGKFAWNNPDIDDHGGDECWASDDSDIGVKLKVNDEYSNVSKNFTDWFAWGFFFNLFALFIGIAQIIVYCIKSDLVKKVFAIMTCPFFLYGFLWFIAGMVLRLRHIGKVCAGDY